MTRDKVTIQQITKRAGGEPRLTMITAYDYTSARLVDGAGVDLILVGDSLGQFMLGYPSTVPVTMEEMLHHCRAVRRAQPAAFVVGDLPFGSYQVDRASAVANAVRLIKEGGCEAVKLEGGAERADTIAAIVAAGIPVMGHIGLLPQSEHLTGGHLVQGRTAAAAERLVSDGTAVAAAGCFAIVVEAVPRRIGAELTRRVPVPTIGIGAGAGCDGQVLIFHEVIGMTTARSPRFVKHYADVGEQIRRAVERFCAEVRSGEFPDRDHSYLMDRGELAAFQERLRGGSPAAGQPPSGPGSAIPTHAPQPPAAQALAVQGTRVAPAVAGASTTPSTNAPPAAGVLAEPSSNRLAVASCLPPSPAGPAVAAGAAVAPGRPVVAEPAGAARPLGSVAQTPVRRDPTGANPLAAASNTVRPTPGA